MTRYLIAFNDGDMPFPRPPELGRDTETLSRDLDDAGVLVFGAGLVTHEVVSVVAPDGTVTDGPYPGTKEHLGGFAIVDVPSRKEALDWAARIAAACRCPQQVFELLPDRNATRSATTRYLIAFKDGDMTFPRAELADVARSCTAVRREAKQAGAWVFSAGLGHHEVVSVMATDGTVTDGPYPETKEHLGGLAIVDVPSRKEALDWAARIAAACRCPQQVFELLPPSPEELEEA